jgi:pimeloyl-ACP methyl ester carboxylesterase
MAINYTKSEGVSIGYSVSGSGDQSLIYVPGAYSNLAMERYIPESVAWEKFLEKFGRIITFDKRASGVSDRTARPLNLDQQVVDVEAVRAAAEAEDLIVCGMSQGAPLAVLYALAYPERTRALILLEGVCCDAADPFADLSDKNTLFDWERSLAKFDSDFTAWCLDFCNLLAPNQSEEDLDLNVEYMLATASPASHRFIWRCLMGFDIRPMLRHVTQPTLVIHGKEDRLYPVAHGRYFAEHIPGAEYFETASGVHMPMFDQTILPELHERIGRFVSDLPPRQSNEEIERFVSTILFTDIVDSTQQQRQLGDQIWSERISHFERNSSAIVEQCRGKVVGTTGDGIVATFDVPGDGLRAARKLVDDSDNLGHPVRIGLHTGEVQRTISGVQGLAVTMASRVANVASAGEVLTTTVTQGIVEGGEHQFADWGEAELKGIGNRKLVRLV